MTGYLASVNVARVRNNPARQVHVHAGAEPQITGIDKHSTADAVALHALGVVGDSVCDTVHHGGLDQAVYAYAGEDADWWQAELGAELTLPMRPGLFGENLTTRGVDITGAVIGERWQVGTALLQVCVPRIACTTLAAYWDVSRLIKRFTAANRPGAYLRVLTDGVVRTGDAVIVTERPAHGVTIGEAFRAMNGDLTVAGRVAAAAELPVKVRRRVAKLASSYSAT